MISLFDCHLAKYLTTENKSILENTNNIGDSDTYGELERELSNSLRKGILDLIEKSTKDNYTVNSKNCPDLYDLFYSSKSTSNKLRAYMPTFMKIKSDVEQGLIRLVFDKTSTLGKLIYAVPIQIRNTTSTVLIVNCAVFMVSKEIITGDEREIEYQISDNMKLVELLNMCSTVKNVAHDSAPIFRNTGIKKSLIQLYSEMLIKVLASDTAVAANRDNAKDLFYYCANFVQYHMFKIKTEALINSFSASVAEITNDRQIVLDKKVERYRNSDTVYSSLTEFISFLSETFKPLENITLPYLTRKYTNHYSLLSVLSLDYLPYLTAMMVSGYTGHLLTGINVKKNFQHITRLKSVDLLTIYR